MDIPQTVGFSDDWLNLSREKVEEQLADDGIEGDDIRQAFKDTFTTPAGRIVLEYMTRLQGQPTFYPELGFHNGAAMGFWRDGQNSIATLIRNMMSDDNG